ncbi:MAG: phosphoribosylamine--glycine ligase [Planctomycetaceae bacterium]
MRVLVVGGGGREHAIVWRLTQSPSVERVYCAPGNAGIAALAECVEIGANDFDGLAAFAKQAKIGLTVVGPEEPLCRGLVDRFEAEGLRAFGPRKSAAELEGSKVFSKRVMTQSMVPTAVARPFSDFERAREFLEGADWPLVIKADGLAAGKGVFVVQNYDEAATALQACFSEGRFGEAGRRVLIEEYLQGEEASVLALTDGKTIAVLPTARDYKRALDGDRGLNTGGMGAYSPTPAVTPAIMDLVVGQILVPIVHAMNREGRPYKGVLFAGLMLTKGGPKALEFNVRFGDPEAQAVLMRLRTDLLQLLLAVQEGTLDRIELEYDERPACCVVLASENYPATGRMGMVIHGLADVTCGEDLQVFHAGTGLRGRDVVTTGGRVLGVTALGADLADARARAYAACKRISFDGMRFRTDIASVSPVGSRGPLPPGNRGPVTPGGRGAL